MKKVPSQVSVHIKVCRNARERNYYFREFVKMLQSRVSIEYDINPISFIVFEKEDEYRFLIPGRPEKLAGLSISDWEELGTAMEHPSFWKFVDELDRRVV